MKISVIGTGYVGLVSGACFAEVGIQTICVDIDQTKIDNLKKGIIPIFEPGLDGIVKRNFDKGRLHFTTSLEEAVSDSQVVFIAVGTPPNEDGSADLKHVLKVASDIGKYMQDYAVIVTKSTVPVGTSHKVKYEIQSQLTQRGVDITFDVASNPEFLKEGAAVNDFLKPDRIVVGVESERAKEYMNTLYKPFILNGHPLIFMDIPSSEMTKYTANAMLATKISFMNDIANLCEIMGADVNMVRKGIGSDPRIGTKFIYPGVGYGGSCFPKDVKALVRTAREHNYEMRILQSVEDVNDDQKSVLYNKVEKFFDGELKGKRFAMWGLSFKPQTDDMREAPSLVIIDLLIKAGAEVVAYDPVAIHETQKMIGDKISYVDEQYKALEGADALLLVTEWPEFRLPDYKKMSEKLKNKVVFDGRNIYDRVEMEKNGFKYACIGQRINA